jgi:hypothetical protein
MARDWDIGADGDLLVANADVVIVEDANQVALAVQVAINTFRGEWFLNTEAGVPYYQNVLGKKVVATTAEFDSVIRAAVLGVEGVNRIVAYESSFDDRSRQYTVAFTADTIYGPIDYEGVLP